MFKVLIHPSVTPTYNQLNLLMKSVLMVGMCMAAGMAQFDAIKKAAHTVKDGVEKAEHKVENLAKEEVHEIEVGLF